MCFTQIPDERQYTGLMGILAWAFLILRLRRGVSTEFRDLGMSSASAHFWHCITDNGPLSVIAAFSWGLSASVSHLPALSCQGSLAYGAEKAAPTLSCGSFPPVRVGLGLVMGAHFMMLQ